MQSLSRDCLIQIMLFLDFPDLLFFARSCKKFNKCLNEDIFWFARLYHEFPHYATKKPQDFSFKKFYYYLAYDSIEAIVKVHPYSEFLILAKGAKSIRMYGKAVVSVIDIFGNQTLYNLDKSKGTVIKGPSTRGIKMEASRNFKLRNDLRVPYLTMDEKIINIGGNLYGGWVITESHKLYFIRRITDNHTEILKVDENVSVASMNSKMLHYVKDYNLYYVKIKGDGEQTYLSVPKIVVKGVRDVAVIDNVYYLTMDGLLRIYDSNQWPRLNGSYIRVPNFTKIMGNNYRNLRILGQDGKLYVTGIFDGLYHLGWAKMSTELVSVKLVLPGALDMIAFAEKSYVAIRRNDFLSIL